MTRGICRRPGLFPADCDVRDQSSLGAPSVNMEADRETANLGDEQPTELQGETNIPKQPKRRFIGRRAAVERAAASANASSSIEDSGAVQGAAHLSEICHEPAKLTALFSGSTSPFCQDLEPDP